MSALGLRGVIMRYWEAVRKWVIVRKTLMDLQGSYFVRPDLVMFFGAWCGHHALVRRYYTEVI